MSWAKFDDQYPDHPKICEVGPIGMALHLAATCYCARYLTDGFVPSAIIPRLLNLDGVFIECNGVCNAVTNVNVTRSLVAAGLFEEVSGGYMVHDYLEYNPPAEQVKAERAAAAERLANWRAKKARNAVSNGVSNGVTNVNVTPSPSPSPSPIKEEDTHTQPQRQFSESAVADNLVMEVTGWMAIPPSPENLEFMHDVPTIIQRKKENSKEYLLPFWSAYEKRYPGSTRLAWIGWALTGKIPKEKAPAPPRVGSNGKPVQEPMTEERYRREHPL